VAAVWYVCAGKDGRGMAMVMGSAVIEGPQAVVW
jgi:hypothetical protein